MWNYMQCARLLTRNNFCRTVKHENAFKLYSSIARKGDVHNRSPLAEARPDYDIEGAGLINEGERLVKPTLGTVIDVEEVRDAALWKHVEAILPRKVVPEVPKHESYPTPSGWYPPTEKSNRYPYKVGRTKYHNFPIFLEMWHVGRSHMTLVNHVEGDIWKCEADLRAFLERRHNDPDWPVITQVDEVSKKIRIRGKYMDDVADFLTERGM